MSSGTLCEALLSAFIYILHSVLTSVESEFYANAT